MVEDATKLMRRLPTCPPAKICTMPVVTAFVDQKRAVFPDPKRPEIVMKEIPPWKDARERSARTTCKQLSKWTGVRPKGIFRQSVFG
jgi:hypothetical protein